MKNKIANRVYSWYLWMARFFHAYQNNKQNNKIEVQAQPSAEPLLPVLSPAPSQMTLSFSSEGDRLRKAIQRLNETILLESDLFIVLREVGYSQPQLSPRSNLYFKEPVSRVVSLLRGDIRKIRDRELKLIANHFLFQYESLSKYLIFIFSEPLNEVFAVFYNQVKNLTEEVLLLEAEEEAQEIPLDASTLYPIFNDIFRSIEAIRFMTNKKNSFTKNLQEAARLSSKQLRKNLERTKVGLDFLNVCHRMDIKEKFDMRSRFKWQ